jgi:hypothetical protein
MSFWIRRQGADGRGRIYTANPSLLLVMLLIAILAAWLGPFLMRWL